MAEEKMGNTEDNSEASAAGWKFNASDQAEASGGPAEKVSDVPAVTWTAQEFIAHSKNPGWYLMLVIVTVFLAGLLYVMTHDIVTVVVIVIGGGIFGFMGSRQPRELQYSVGDKGISIGPKQFQYAQFKTFSIVQEVGIESIWLMPNKRFMPAITLYFEPPDQKKIVDVISQYLPMENRQLDAFDKLMHQIHF